MIVDLKLHAQKEKTPSVWNFSLGQQQTKDMTSK